MARSTPSIARKVLPGSTTSWIDPHRGHCVIIYQATKAQFLDDNDNRNIEDVIEREYVKHTRRYAQRGMVRSWQGSLAAMANVLRDKDIPDDIGVGVEYGIPQTAKSIDIIL